MDADELGDAIGANVRRLRTAMGLSQDGLADAASLSKGTVVAIEQQRSNPSVATLCALSEALAVGLATLLEPPAGPLLRQRHADDAVELWSTVAGSSARLLLGTDPPEAVELWEWELAPGDVFDGSAHPRGTIETLLVSSGALEVTVAGRSTRVGARETLAFEAHEPHTYASDGDDVARFTMWITVGDVGALPPLSSVGSTAAED